VETNIIQKQPFMACIFEGTQPEPRPWTTDDSRFSDSARTCFVTEHDCILPNPFVLITDRRLQFDMRNGTINQHYAILIGAAPHERKRRP